MVVMGEDTIAAIATPPGQGGIGIVRLSGPDAVAIVSGVFISSTGKNILSDSRPVYHGEVRDGDACVDEVLVHVMRHPHSYTSEDVVEINGHGGMAPLNAILELVLSCGARLAEPGEFTRRAFMNGRIDLVQAESVMDRIQAQTRAGLQAASAAAQGRLSETLHALHATLVDAKAYVEAAVDFPDDDLPDLITPELKGRIDDVRQRMGDLYATADAGKLLREGATVALAGRPNVGKSSLFNALLRDARAIVTAHAGTTRDRLEEVISLEGIPVKLVDMAGLRETSDEVERIGVAAARQALTESAMIVMVVDVSSPLEAEDRLLLDELQGLDTPLVLVYNKSDLESHPDTIELEGAFSGSVRVSAKTGAGLNELETLLANRLRGDAVMTTSQAMLTRVHQKDSLRRSIEAIARMQGNYDQSPEFMSIDLDDAIRALGEITGETTPDDVLERIFSAFCIGK
jgi:tRNA modification GTPase